MRLKVLAFALITILLALIYSSSFNSPFFQDDRQLLELSKASNLFAPINLPNFPYRPISIGVFYSLGRVLSGNNPLGFHLILFFSILVSGLFLYLIARRLKFTPEQSFLSLIFYLFNISLFALFFWIATSYFSIGVMFFFGAIYFYLRDERWSFPLTVLFSVLAYLSNEIAFLLPGIFLLISCYQKKFNWRLWSFLMAGVILFIFRSRSGLPGGSYYHLTFSPQVVASFRWYLLRALNLPEGVNRTVSLSIWLSFLSYIGLWIYQLLRGWKGLDKRFLFLVAGLFIISGLPFFLVPNHMSSYYITPALLAPALLFGKTISGRWLTILTLVSYIILTIVSLNFLSATHWIILKNTGPVGAF